MCNLHYNIAIVAIVYKHSLVLLPAVRLSDIPLYYTLQPRPVIALGRDVDSKAFLVSCGKLVREYIELDCKELLICSCDISEVNWLHCYILVFICNLAFLVLHYEHSNQVKYDHAFIITCLYYILLCDKLGKYDIDMDIFFICTFYMYVQHSYKLCLFVFSIVFFSTLLFLWHLIFLRKS